MDRQNEDTYQEQPESKNTQQQENSQPTGKQSRKGKANKKKNQAAAAQAQEKQIKQEDAVEQEEVKQNESQPENPSNGYQEDQQESQEVQEEDQQESQEVQEEAPSSKPQQEEQPSSSQMDNDPQTPTSSDKSGMKKYEAAEKVEESEQPEEEVQQKQSPVKNEAQAERDDEKVQSQSEVELKGEEKEATLSAQDDQEEADDSDDQVQNSEDTTEYLMKPEDMGTQLQNDVIEDYPTLRSQDKLRVPYIEKKNGNILILREDYRAAMGHYNKALFAIKMLFQNDNNIITSHEQAAKLIEEIEIPVSLNLGLAYLKTGEYHYAIKFMSNIIDKELENSRAFFRRGMAYMGIGELNKAKSDLMKAYELTSGKDAKVIEALQQLKDKQESNRLKEIEVSKKMLQASEFSKRSEVGQQPPSNNQVVFGENHEEQGKDVGQDQPVPQQEMDSMFMKMMTLIKTILLLPFVIYTSLFEGFVRIFLKLALFGISIAEYLPIVGPRVTWAVTSLSETRLFKWIHKQKEE